MVESILLCERTWVQVPCMSFMCYLNYYYYFNNVLGHEE